LSSRTVLDGLKATYNVGKIFRSAQAFGAAGVDLIGISQFNPYPAQGAFRYVPARFLASFEEAHAALTTEGFTIFALLPPGPGQAGATDLGVLELPEKSAFVLGHEEHGVSFRPEDFPDVRPLAIPMFGAVQSLNVSVAASVVMFEYTRQHGRKGATP